VSDNELPTLTAARTDIEEPRCANFKIDKEPPNLAKLLTDTEDAICTVFTTDNW
jgi:hypothetical protein